MTKMTTSELCAASREEGDAVLSQRPHSDLTATSQWPEVKTRSRSSLWRAAMAFSAVPSLFFTAMLLLCAAHTTPANISTQIKDRGGNSARWRRAAFKGSWFWVWCWGTTWRLHGWGPWRSGSPGSPWRRPPGDTWGEETTPSETWVEWRISPATPSSSVSTKHIMSVEGWVRGSGLVVVVLKTLGLLVSPTQPSTWRWAGWLRTFADKTCCVLIQVTFYLKTAEYWGPSRIRSCSAASWRERHTAGAEPRAFSSSRKEMRRGNKTATSWGPTGRSPGTKQASVVMARLILQSTAIFTMSE